MLETFIISGKSITINMYFTVRHLELYLENYNQSGNYKLSFSKIIYYMYSKTNQESTSVYLTENDFINAADSELAAILNDLLNDDESAKQEFDKSVIPDIFERFYSVYNNYFKAPIDLSKMCEMLNYQTNNYKMPDFSSILELVETQNSWTQSIHIPQISESLAKALTINLPQFESFAHTSKLLNLNSVSDLFSKTALDYTSLLPKFNFPEFTSLLSNIPKVHFDINKILSPFTEQLSTMQSDLAERLRSSFDAISKPFAGIDFTLLTHQNKWSKQHDTLVKFGWFYLDELSEELINEIHSNKETFTSDEVNQRIVFHFRKESCALLKTIVKRWKVSPYFKPREHVFHEALTTHSRRNFNASVTLLALHTEGVLTDFVRIGLKLARYKTEAAIKDISTKFDNLPLSVFKHSDWQVYDFVLEKIQTSFAETFELSNPDAASNNSRHKIAHGHAVDKESEINSLKLFLYLNEIFKLLSVLDSNILDESIANI